MSGSIHIGTSGWSYKHWKGLYYPEKLPARSWLNYYSQSFDVTEINGSFYRLPTIETVHSWMEQVPGSFLFCPKMSRYLTHMKKLRQPEEPLDRFFSVFGIMQPRMGPILLQLPPQLAFQPEVTEYFYRLLQVQYPEFSFVMEVRHESWLQEESLALMEHYGLALVLSLSGGFFPEREWIRTKNIYLRFHGPEALYASSYSTEILEAYAIRMLQWQEEGHAIWAFFNNDIGGHAVANAKALQQMVQKKEGR